MVGWMTFSRKMPFQASDGRDVDRDRVARVVQVGHDQRPRLGRVDLLDADPVAQAAGAFCKRNRPFSTVEVKA